MADLFEPMLLGDFHDGDIVRLHGGGSELTVHHDGDPWLARIYELVKCPHEAATAVGVSS